MQPVHEYYAQPLQQQQPAQQYNYQQPIDQQPAQDYRSNRNRSILLKSRIQMIQILNDLSQTIQFGSKFDSNLSENFNTILIRLFDLLPHRVTNVQLSALRDILQFHSKEFSNYIELTICK